MSFKAWLDKIKRRFGASGDAGKIEVVEQRDHQPLAARSGARQATPAVDIYELDNQLTLVADVPGACRESAEVSWDGEEKLALLAHSQHRFDGAFVDYNRAFTLAPAYDGTAASASIRDGVLTIRVPRKQAFVAKHIPVREVI
jgi:HSP20 family protein